MTPGKNALSALFTLCALGLGACSGGSGSDQVSGIEGSGDTIATSPSAGSGAITGFGSIYVNGIRYNTDEAEFWIDGKRASEADLDTGMVVEIEASTTDSGAQATAVRYEPLAVGPIGSVETLDATRKQLTLLGQTLVVGEDATFAGVDYAELQPGMVVAISGFAATGDAVVVSRLEYVADQSLDQVWEVTGRIGSVDAANARFTLGGVTIDYSEATFATGSAGDLAADVEIRVEGILANDSTLVAQTVEIDEGFVREAIDNEDDENEPVPVSLEGIIESFESPAHFVVADTRVDASGASIERGTEAQLGEGVRVVVTGELSQEGAITAESVALVLPNEVHLGGPVDQVDLDKGTLTVAGNLLTVDDLTVFEDLGAQNNRRIRLRDLRIGESVNAYARGHQGVWLATRIERLSDTEQVTVTGPAVQISRNSLTVLGIEIDITGAELPPNFSAIGPGTFVSVEGQLTGDKTMVATRVAVHSRGPCQAPVDLGCGKTDMPEEEDEEDEQNERGPGLPKIPGRDLALDSQF